MDIKPDDLTRYEKVEAVLTRLPYKSTELMKSTAISAVFHSLDNKGNITHTTLERLYKHLQDDFDITTGGAESRINTLRKDMFNTMPDGLKFCIFSNIESVSNYTFIIKLSEYVVRHW